MVVLIDFLDVDQVDALPLLAARHEVLCLAVRDPLARPANAGLLGVEGLGVVDTSDSALQARCNPGAKRAEAGASGGCPMRRRSGRAGRR